ERAVYFDRRRDVVRAQLLAVERRKDREAILSQGPELRAVSGASDASGTDLREVDATGDARVRIDADEHRQLSTRWMLEDPGVLRRGACPSDPLRDRLRKHERTGGRRARWCEHRRRADRARGTDQEGEGDRDRDAPHAPTTTSGRRRFLRGVRAWFQGGALQGAIEVHLVEAECPVAQRQAAGLRRLARGATHQAAAAPRSELEPADPRAVRPLPSDRADLVEVAVAIVCEGREIVDNDVHVGIIAQPQRPRTSRYAIVMKMSNARSSACPLCRPANPTFRVPCVSF